MNDFNAAVADMDSTLLDAFGEDATVQRGAGTPVPVRAFIERNVEKLGDYGQVVARVNRATFQNSQWIPQQGDVLVYSTGTRKVESIDSDDGFMTVAVLNG